MPESVKHWFWKLSASTVVWQDKNKNWSEIHGFSLFEKQNSSNWKDATWIFGGTRYQLWLIQNLTIELELTHKNMMGFNLVSVFQIFTLILADLLSKSEFCWCRFQFFSKVQKFLVLKLLIREYLMVDPALDSWESEVFKRTVWRYHSFVSRWSQ